VTRVVVPLVSEAHRDAVPGERRPQLLDEPVVQFLGHLPARLELPLNNNNRALTTCFIASTAAGNNLYGTT